MQNIISRGFLKVGFKVVLESRLSQALVVGYILQRASSLEAVSLDTMVDSNSPQSDSPPFSLLATSILGIKGPLRIRPHGSAAKPHIILRRVTVSEDSSEDGEPDNTVRFSLFAAKRIEVKPGRELLLTVASPDGFFQEKAVVFEADLTGDEEISDEKSYTQAPDEEVYLPPAGEAIPPKMRRAWTKKAEEVSSGTRKFFHISIYPFTTLSFHSTLEEPAVTRSSVGVQAEPAYASISTQAQPTCTQVSVQTHSNCVSTAIQVDLPHISTQVQTEDDRRYMSLEVQTDAPTTGLNSWNDRHHPNTVRPSVLYSYSCFYQLRGTAQKPFPHGSWQYSLFTKISLVILHTAAL